MEEAHPKRLFRFGVYEADPETGELRKQGRRLGLSGQPFQVLIMLLERPGELVTREEVRQRLWPDGTFVDFDHGLNTAVNKLRDTLGDSANSPRFIETLARRGYRFISPVELVEGTAPASVPVAPSPFEAPVLAPPPSAPELMPHNSGFGQRWLSQPHELPQPPRFVVRALFFLLQLLYLFFYLMALARLGKVEEIVGDMLPGVHSMVAGSDSFWVVAVLIATASVGIPVRLYLITAVLFSAPVLREKFLKLFPLIFPLDAVWALAPFLLLGEIGFGLALAATAALLYLPFAQRSLILMGAGEAVGTTTPT